MSRKRYRDKKCHLFWFDVPETTLLDEINHPSQCFSKGGSRNILPDGENHWFGQHKMTSFQSNWSWRKQLEQTILLRHEKLLVATSLRSVTFPCLDWMRTAMFYFVELGLMRRLDLSILVWRSSILSIKKVEMNRPMWKSSEWGSSYWRGSTWRQPNWQQ